MTEMGVVRGGGLLRVSDDSISRPGETEEAMEQCQSRGERQKEQEEEYVDGIY